jgi:hypothetical protein
VVAGTFRLEPVEKPMSNTVSQARLGKACPHILCGLLLAAGSEDPEVRAAEYWGRVLAGILNRHSLSSLWPSDFQSNIAPPPPPHWNIPRNLMLGAWYQPELELTCYLQPI